MKGNFLPFSTTMIGSMPRSHELLELKLLAAKDPARMPEYLAKVESETAEVIAFQERCGLDIPVSGELYRDNFASYVAERVPGVTMMTMNEIKAITVHSDSFEASLQQMDAADNSMNNPICTGKLDTEADLDGDELAILQKYRKGPFKITIPSPYLLTRSMWLKEITGQYYANRKELGDDVVKLLIHEIRSLVSKGAKVIQIDEPIISEVVFTPASGSGENTFY